MSLQLRSQWQLSWSRRQSQLSMESAENRYFQKLNTQKFSGYLK